MIAWFRALSGWKLWALVITGTAAISLSTGFVAGKKWEESEQVRDLRNQLAQLDDQARSALTALNAAWEDRFGKAQKEVDDWKAQVAQDQEIMKALNKRNHQLQDKYNALAKKFNETPDFGTCQLSTAAIGLLLDASSTRELPAALPRRDDN